MICCDKAFSCSLRVSSYSKNCITSTNFHPLCLDLSLCGILAEVKKSNFLQRHFSPVAKEFLLISPLLWPGLVPSVQMARINKTGSRKAESNYSFSP